jgi:hypothetical protein
MIRAVISSCCFFFSACLPWARVGLRIRCETKIVAKRTKQMTVSKPPLLEGKSFA